MKGSSKTVWEAFHGKPPDNDFIKGTEWGCSAYLHVEKKHRSDSKFAETALPLVYVGTALYLGYKAYLLSTMDGRRIYVARHNVTIDSFPWRKPAPPCPDDMQNPMLLWNNNTLESMESSDNAIENPEFVVQLDLSEEAASSPNTQESEIVT
eukprot:1353360-Rhodomonas_salina.1